MIGRESIVIINILNITLNKLEIYLNLYFNCDIDVIIADISLLQVKYKIDLQELILILYR